MSSYSVVLVTTPSQSEAIALARLVVEQKLAACVNIFPVQSVYVWQDDLCEEQEWQLILKTRLELFTKLEQTIRERHPYDVPEVIALPIANGSTPYLQWIAAQTIDK